MDQEPCKECEEIVEVVSVRTMKSPYWEALYLLGVDRPELICERQNVAPIEIFIIPPICDLF